MIAIYETSRLMLITPHKSYINDIIDYHKRNKSFLEIWEPERPRDFYTKAYQKAWIKAEQKETENFTGLCLMIVKKDAPKRIIGTVKLSNMMYGNFCSCFLGYRLDKDEINNGYMTEAVMKMLELAFDDFNLHRVEASVIPSNDASKAVLKKAGFRYVGTSASYLKINGEWRSHELYEFINPME